MDKNENTALLMGIKDILCSLDKTMESFIDEDYKKLKQDVADLKVYKVEHSAAEAARKGMITGILRHWPGLIAILTIIVVGALELKKMKP